jgi:hypothetical protein
MIGWLWFRCGRRGIRSRRSGECVFWNGEQSITIPKHRRLSRSVGKGSAPDPQVGGAVTEPPRLGGNTTAGPLGESISSSAHGGGARHSPDRANVCSIPSNYL